MKYSTRTDEFNSVLKPSNLSVEGRISFFEFITKGPYETHDGDGYENVKKNNG